MSLNETVIEKLKDTYTLVGEIQKKSEDVDKKYDGLVQNEIKELSEKADGLFGELDTIKTNIETEKQRSDHLEKLLSRSDNSGVDKSSLDQYSEELDEYLTRGVAPTVDTQKKALTEYVRKNKICRNEGKIDTIMKRLEVGENPDGGYLVFPELSSEMITRVFETSPMRQVANIMVTSNESVDITIDTDEAGADWVGETSPRPETSTPKLGRANITTHELSAEPKATNKMIEDASINIESWLMEKVNRKFTRTENSAFVNGDGHQKPRGFLSLGEWSSPGVYEDDKLETITTAAPNVVDSDDLVNLQNSLVQDYIPGSVWMMKRATFTEVVKLKGDNSNYLFDRTQFLKVGENLEAPVLLGKPVVYADDMPVIAGGAKSIAYGNFGIGYTIVDRLGISVLRDPFTSRGNVIFSTRKRVGGDVSNYQSIKILKVQA